MSRTRPTGARQDGAPGVPRTSHPGSAASQILDATSAPRLAVAVRLQAPPTAPAPAPKAGAGAGATSQEGTRP